MKARKTMESIGTKAPAMAGAVALLMLVLVILFAIVAPGLGAGAEPARSSLQETAPADEPTFKAGIPGLTMVDVRDHKFLWREIEELQSWERAERITIAEYRSKVIEKTIHFLELEGAEADEFSAVGSNAVASTREAFARMRRPGGDPRGDGAVLSAGLHSAAARVGSLMQEGKPRHQLFTPGCKKWLLKLAFGPKESKEAQQSQAATEAEASGK